MQEAFLLLRETALPTDLNHKHYLFCSVSLLNLNSFLVNRQTSYFYFNPCMPRLFSDLASHSFDESALGYGLSNTAFSWTS